MFRTIKLKLIKKGIVKKKPAARYMVYCITCGDETSVEDVYWNKKKGVVCRKCYITRRGK